MQPARSGLNANIGVSYVSSPMKTIPMWTLCLRQQQSPPDRRCHVGYVREKLSLWHLRLRRGLIRSAHKRATIVRNLLLLRQQVTRDLLAVAKFLVLVESNRTRDGRVNIRLCNCGLWNQVNIIAGRHAVAAWRAKRYSAVKSKQYSIEYTTGREADHGATVCKHTCCLLTSCVATSVNATSKLSGDTRR